MSLQNDPRIDPRIAKALELFPGFGGDVSTPSTEATYEECLEYCAEFETAGAEAHPQMMAMMPEFEDVAQTEQVIKGVDGNDIKLLIHKPKEADGKLPGIVHFHGGGMVLATAEDPNYIRWRNALASLGLVVVGVEFRNGGGRLGPHPYPAGLNDCASAVKWTHDHRDQLAVAKIIVSGESGGGNLTLATVLKAKQEGWLDLIQGAYALCPYISGAYREPPSELVSLVENNGYLLDCDMMSALVKVYDPSSEHQGNPLAWPYFATADELSGLPPHVISVNELDPLRDEGLAYYRNLLAAGVQAVGRTVHGTSHGGDMAFADVVPDVYNDTLRSLAGFAKSVQ